jgi:Methyltransferase domain
MRGEVIYPGRDLEAMAFAATYHQWILEVFRPYLGQRLVEVGAGSGLFSALLMKLPTQSLTLVEPSHEMYPALTSQVESSPAKEDIRTYNSIFAKVAAEIKRDRQPDSIIYVNVLEHIKDDGAELEICQTLGSGGRAFIFVPALPWLFGKFDQSIGHYRRYTKRELEQKSQRAGFRVVMSRYFDVMGVLPWWVKYRLLKSSRLEPSTVQLYDKYIVPVARVGEGFVKPPLGKNLILVAEKS